MLRAGRIASAVVTLLVSANASAWDASRARSAPSHPTRGEPTPARSAAKAPRASLRGPRNEGRKNKEPPARPGASGPPSKNQEDLRAGVPRSAPTAIVDKPSAGAGPHARQSAPASKPPKEAAMRLPSPDDASAVSKGSPPRAAKTETVEAAKDPGVPTAKAEKPTKGSKGRAAKQEPPAPSYFRVAKPPPSGASWAPYYRAPWKRGYVTLFGHGKKWSGYLIGSKGEVPAASRASLSDMLASWRTGKEAVIDDRLIAMIAMASDEFGGRPIRVVSGYREYSYAPDSKHKVGQAFDFSIPGVPNEALRDYLRTLSDVGVGYYPNSTHVHLDVRDKATYWVDYSFPGERPHYAYEPGSHGWGPRERAIADALDRLPASMVAADPPATSIGRPPPPFAARPVPNRAFFAPSEVPSAAAGPRRTPAAALTPATPLASSADGGAPIQRAADAGAGFWSRTATVTSDGKSPAGSVDGGALGSW